MQLIKPQAAVIIICWTAVCWWMYHVSPGLILCYHKYGMDKWIRSGLTIFVVRLNHHELFAGPSRALKGPQRPPHQLHLCFHGRQGGKDFFHPFNVLHGLVSLVLIHIQLFLLSSVLPSSLVPALPHRQRLHRTGWASLEGSHRGEQKVNAEGRGQYWKWRGHDVDY